MKRKIRLNLFETSPELLGVFPVHSNKFFIGSKGRASVEEEDFIIINELTTFSPSIENQQDEWYPMNAEGWRRAAVTGKALSFAFAGKRSYGDPGNDYVASKKMSTGKDCETVMKWELPSGESILIPCVISVSTPAGGDTTNIDGLEFEIISDGKPTVTIPNL